VRGMNKDHAFDKLLERTARPREQSGAPTGCLDAEMLAAWTDGELTPADRAVAEAHAAGCDRCLAMLGAMARITPVPSTAENPRWFAIRWLVPFGAAAVAVIALLVVQRTPDESVPLAPQAATDAVQDRASSLDEVKEQERKPLQARSGSESLRKDSAVPPATSSTPAAAAALPEGDTTARFELRRETEKTAAIILSPQSSTKWRIAGPSVQRSSDGGITWQAQATGTTVTLLAGSSPAPTVCWIVGRSGTVLLSTDGATWRRLTFPEPPIDLVAVSAADEMTATVTTANGSIYRTVDAGQTWTLQ
jgi:hypothetical protein